MDKDLKRERLRRLRLIAQCFLDFVNLSLVIFLCFSLLTGCANSLTPLSDKWPDRQPIPAELAKSDLPDARQFSEKVSAYFQKVQDFLNGSQSEKTQSQASKNSAK